jgi:hypothetical protein
MRADAMGNPMLDLVADTERERDDERRKNEQLRELLGRVLKAVSDDALPEELRDAIREALRQAVRVLGRARNGAGGTRPGPQIGGNALVAFSGPPEMPISLPAAARVAPGP